MQWTISYSVLRIQRVYFLFLFLIGCLHEATIPHPLNGDSNPNPDLCDADAVLHLLSYQANLEQVVVWVDSKPVDVKIGNVNTGIFQLYLTQ